MRYIPVEELDQNMPRPHQDLAANAGPHLPYAVETLPQKIARFLPAEEKFGGSHSDDLFSSSISSRPSKKKFHCQWCAFEQSFSQFDKKYGFRHQRDKKNYESGCKRKEASEQILLLYSAK